MKNALKTLAQKIVDHKVAIIAVAGSVLGLVLAAGLTVNAVKEIETDSTPEA